MLSNSWPWLRDKLQRDGWDAAVCDHTDLFKNTNVGFITAVFNATKCLEWIGTLFLIVRKRKLRFLHVFHHLCTVLYCLHAQHFTAYSDASGIWFVVTNTFIHTWMYGYYAVRTLGLKPPGAKLLTFAQISQMVLGSAVALHMFSCPDAGANMSGHVFALVMYVCYFVLFAKLLLAKAPTTKKKT